MVIRTLILNDTARTGHLGCRLVMQNLKSLCTDHGLQVLAALATMRGDFDFHLRRALPDCDLVLINGEGTMHHDRAGAMILTRAGHSASRGGKPVALLNTVWEENRAANALLSCVAAIYARESRSAAAIAREAKIPVHTVPDLSLAAPSEAEFGTRAARRGGVLVLDDVRLQACLLLAAYARKRSFAFRCMDFPAWRVPWREQAWLRLALMGMMPSRLRSGRPVYDADVVVTGRFHGACLAILAGTPFVAMSSNTYKIEGLLDDAKLGEGGVLLTDEELADDPFATLDAAVSAVQALRRDSTALDRYRQACRAYLERARAGHAAMFARLAALACARQEITEEC